MTEVSSFPSVTGPDPTPARPRRLRRWLPAACLTAAVATLGAGLAQAFLSSSGTGTGSATTGTVGVDPLQIVQKTCQFSTLTPGDLTGADTCSLQATYTGNVPAWESLTVEVQAPTGAALYDGSGTHGLLLAITDDGGNSFTVPLGAGTTGGSCPAGDTCWTTLNDLAAWYSGGTPSLTFTNGDTATWMVTPSFPSTSGNAYQSASATVTLTVNAVQSQGNDLPLTCTTSTIGRPCPAAPPFAWS